jgi:hypothetical protein
MGRLLLVDFENVGHVELDAIPNGVRVLFFFGASQKSVPTAFLRSALRLGDSFVPIDIEGRGKNALDFHVAYYLGEYLAREPATQCAILSNDKGFDPLVRHLTGRHLAVRRVASINAAFPELRGSATRSASDLDELRHAAVRRLTAMQKTKRPRKRKGLAADLYSHFAKKVPEARIQDLIEQMIAAKQLSEMNGAITYHL